MKKVVWTLVRGIAQIRKIVAISNFIGRFIGFINTSWGIYKIYSKVANIGEDVFCNWMVEIKYGENIQIGDNVIIGRNVTFGAKSKIVIGNNVRISKNVMIETAGLKFGDELPYPHISKPIEICNNVWIAANATVLGGVTIGENVIVGAGVVISKDVPPNTIVVGAQNRYLK
ncbi:acyltransferase [Jiulongibacter sp. NS-SX5]|uniref:acyltransferase n=1 Tax=Jiulongibacter sp. NS-SX5 TaxID=3463854 RepID=UPI004059D8B3